MAVLFRPSTSCSAIWTMILTKSNQTRFKFSQIRPGLLDKKKASNLWRGRCRNSSLRGAFAQLWAVGTASLTVSRTVKWSFERGHGRHLWDRIPGKNRRLGVWLRCLTLGGRKAGLAAALGLSRSLRSLVSGFFCSCFFSSSFIKDNWLRKRLSWTDHSYTRLLLCFRFQKYW